MKKVEGRMKNFENAPQSARRLLHYAFSILHSLPKNILLVLVRIYRLTISPAQVFLFGAGAGCRFTPTCSVYAADAVRQHGAAAGSWLAAKRLCRCHPWGEAGHDPVPPGRLPSPDFHLPTFTHGS